jgi:hypothetical protein
MSKLNDLPDSQLLPLYQSSAGAARHHSGGERRDPRLQFLTEAVESLLLK